MSTYGPQRFTGGSFTQSAAYHSSAFGGGNAPISGYPEIASMENLKTVSGAGPEGQNILDAVDTADYTTAGAQFLGNGPLTNGQFDARGSGLGFRFKRRIKLLSSALAEAGYGAPLILVNGGTSGTDGQTNSNWFAVVEMYRSSGANFQWDLTYWQKSGGSFVSAELNGDLDLAPDVADNLWHWLEVQVVPGTVTGAFNGSGGPGSGTIANDGSIRLLIDDVEVLSATGVPLVVNKWATSQPSVYYGRGFWLGDGSLGTGADIGGPATDLEWLDIVEGGGGDEGGDDEGGGDEGGDEGDCTPPVTDLPVVNVRGLLYNEQGELLTKGRLHIKPSRVMAGGGRLVAPVTKTTNVGVDGLVCCYLAPSNGIPYLVEFDSDPDDTATPMQIKPGYFTDTWDVPSVGPVNVADL